MNENIRQFLHERHILAEDIDLDLAVDEFIAAMQHGLQTEGGEDVKRLPMIPTYIRVGKKIPVNERIIVLDAGGTNFRVATVYFDEALEPHVDHFEVHAMPGSDRELTKPEFFNKILDYLEPVLPYSKKIGFCFSYAAEILPNRDGVVKCFSKEVRVPEVVGEAIGENLLAAMRARGYSDDYHFVVLNDTVAALLGGMMQAAKRAFDSNLGLIVGTGINCAYVEEVSHIEKIQSHLAIKDQGGYMVVNTESGTFHPSFCSAFDDELDLSTNDPGSYRMEKMVSGRYLGLNGLYVIREAIEVGGLFSDFFEQRFDRIHELSSRDLNDFIENPYGPNLLSHCCCNVIDRENLYALIDNVFERAVRFIVVNLAAIMKMRGLGKSPVKPVMISADGSTFYKSKLIRPKLTYYLRQYLNDQLGHYCEIIHVEQGNLIGAAIAGLTNER